MTALPTAPDRAFRLGGFATLIEALEFAAHVPEGDVVHHDLAQYDRRGRSR